MDGQDNIITLPGIKLSELGLYNKTEAKDKNQLPSPEREPIDDVINELIKETEKIHHELGLDELAQEQIERLDLQSSVEELAQALEKKFERINYLQKKINFYLEEIELSLPE